MHFHNAQAVQKVGGGWGSVGTSAAQSPTSDPTVGILEKKMEITVLGLGFRGNVDP